jgi:hypothetical protein
LRRHRRKHIRGDLSIDVALIEWDTSFISRPISNMVPATPLQELTRGYTACADMDCGHDEEVG